jgi:solute carrier family 44 protein 1 (choline transporter-like protein)/choline transporter-like protein 2/4/5
MYGLTIGTIIDIEGFNIDGGVMRKYYINSLAGYTLPFPAFMATFLLLFGLNVNNMFNSYALSVWFFTKKKDVVEVVVI